MALFSSQPKESKEEKQTRKAQELLRKYGLEELSDSRDAQSVKSIAWTLTSNNLIELGTALSGSAQDLGKLTYLSALIEQNWIIIRQLDRLNKNLEK